jgi:exopolysaccharide biosynthesis polyprenyl glycosylphosphotransferase
MSIAKSSVQDLSIVLPKQRRAMAQERLARQTYLHSLQQQSPSRSLALLPFAALGLDLVAVSITMTVAGFGRNQLGALASDPQGLSSQLAVAAPLIAIAWILGIALAGGYQEKVLGAGTDEYRRVVNASFVTAAVIGIGCFVCKFDLSRGFYVLTLLVGPMLLLAGRLLLRRALNRARSRGVLSHRALIVGTEAHVDEVAEVLGRESWLGYDVVGALTPKAIHMAETQAGVPILGSADGVAEMAHTVHADVVFFAGGAVESAAELRQLAWDLEHSDCQVVVAPSLTDVSPERVRVRPVGGLPLLHLEKPRAAAAARRAKRTFDVVGSFMLLVMLSPVLLFSAIQVWRYDKGPILFKQQRIGRGGATFDCWKFRTMVIDAEARMAEILREQGAEKGVFVKIKEDPRITAPGQWLRRFSLDELPQLVNVLRGDMSLVGPRPQVQDEVALYDDVMARRLHVRPGMTGLWQVSGRSDLSLEEAIRLDLYYVDNWSMIQDLTILARTFGAVFGSAGAY